MSTPIEKPLMIFVKPLPGMRVKDPDTLLVLKEEGEEKPAESYWFRRIADKEVELIDRSKFDKATGTGEAAVEEKTKPADDMEARKLSFNEAAPLDDEKQVNTGVLGVPVFDGKNKREAAKANEKKGS